MQDPTIDVIMNPFMGDRREMVGDITGIYGVTTDFYDGG